jgi:hypothetical protein
MGWGNYRPSSSATQVHGTSSTPYTTSQTKIDGDKLVLLQVPLKLGEVPDARTPHASTIGHVAERRCFKKICNVVDVNLDLQYARKPLRIGP